MTLWFSWSTHFCSNWDKVGGFTATDVIKMSLNINKEHLLYAGYTLSAWMHKYIYLSMNSYSIDR